MASSAPLHIDRHAEVDWLQQVTLWRRTSESRFSVVDKRVATGPLGVVVSQAIALYPVDREALFVTNDADAQVLEWRDIFDLAQRDDYPFNI